MNNYRNQGAPERQQKSDECYARIIGYVKPISRREGEPIRIFDCKTGKSVIHFYIERRKPLPSDASGQPREKTSLFKVKAFTNSRLTREFLAGIVPGMKIGITAEPIVEYPKDAAGNQLPPEIVFEAFVIEILEKPVQAQYPPYQSAQPSPAMGHGYPQQGMQYAPASYPNQPYGQPGGQYVPQGGFAPQGGLTPPPPSQPQPQQRPYQGQPRYAQPAPPPYYEPAPVPVDMPDFDSLPDA